MERTSISVLRCNASGGVYTPYEVEKPSQKITLDRGFFLNPNKLVVGNTYLSSGTDPHVTVCEVDGDASVSVVQGSNTVVLQVTCVASTKSVTVNGITVNGESRQEYESSSDITTYVSAATTEFAGVTTTDSVVIGKSNEGDKSKSVVIGSNCVINYSETVVIGTSCKSSGAVAIGVDIDSSVGTHNVAVGKNLRTNGGNAVVIGTTLSANEGCVVIGSSFSLPTEARNALVIGASAGIYTGCGTDFISFGSYTKVFYGRSSVIIGNQSVSNASESVAIGYQSCVGDKYGSKASLQYAVAIGSYATAGANYAVAIGPNANVTENYGISIGTGTARDHDVVIGFGGAWYGNGYNVCLGSFASLGVINIANADADNTNRNGITQLEDGRLYILGLGGFDGTTLEGAKSLQEIIAELQAK